MPTLRFVINGQQITRDVSPETLQDPASIAAIVQETQGQAAETQRQAAPSTTTTPTSQTEEPTAPGAIPVTAISEFLARKLPAPGAAVVRAVGQRTLDPAARLIAGESGGALGTAADVAQVATTPMAPGVSAIGAGVQALSEVVSDDQNTAKLLGGVAEVLSGVGGMVRTGIRAARAGKSLVRTGLLETETGAADLLPRERLSVNLIRGIRSSLGTTRKELKAGLDQVERGFIKQTPLIQPGTPGYVKLEDMLKLARESAAKLDARSTNILRRIDAALNPPPVKPGEPAPDPRPVASRLIVRLRKTLRDQMRFKNADSPDASAIGRKAASIRRLATDAMESGMDDVLAGQFSEARTAYLTQVVEPFRALRTVLSQDKSPMQAYDVVFNSQDPSVFRTVMRLSHDSPAIAAKLRLGYLEKLREATGGFEDAAKANKVFQRERQMLAATGLFSPEELSSLDVLLRRRELPNLGEALASFFTTPRGMLRLGVSQGVGFMLTRDPSILPIAAIASGALPSLRRMTILPRGSSEGRKLATVAMNQIFSLASTLGREQMANPDQVEVTDDEP